MYDFSDFFTFYEEKCEKRVEKFRVGDIIKKKLHCGASVERNRRNASMETEGSKKNKPLWLRIIKWFFVSVAGMVAVVLFTVVLLWQNEIRTLLSVEEIRPRDAAHHDGAVYYVDVRGGFYLNDLMEQGGISSDGELADFVVNRLTKGLAKNLKISTPDYGCASFTATAADGDALFARNYDNDETNTCIVRTHARKGRHATISTADLSFVGIKPEKGVQGIMDKALCLAVPYLTLDGVNDAGVSCCINMTYQGGGDGGTAVATNQNTEKPDMTSTLMLRMILDYADDLEEAIEIVQRYDLHDSAHTSFHYMVADASGRSAILEWVCGDDITDNDGSARKLVVTYNDADAQIGVAEGSAEYQWMTNYIIQPGYYPSDKEKLGFDRYRRIEEVLGASDGVVQDEWEAMNLLGQIARRNWKPGQHAYTPHSAVYNLTERSVLWVSNENFEDETAIFEFRVK